MSLEQKNLLEANFVTSQDINEAFYKLVDEYVSTPDNKPSVILPEDKSVAVTARLLSTKATKDLEVYYHIAAEAYKLKYMLEFWQTIVPEAYFCLPHPSTVGRFGHHYINHLPNDIVEINHLNIHNYNTHITTHNKFLNLYIWTKFYNGQILCILDGRVYRIQNITKTDSSYFDHASRFGDKDYLWDKIKCFRPDSSVSTLRRMILNQVKVGKALTLGEIGKDAITLR